MTYPLLFYGNLADDYRNKELGDMMYLFALSKYYNFVDSVLIIAKGNYRQMSFTQIIHRTSMTNICFYNYILIPYCGDLWVIMALNSSVNVILYSHFLYKTICKKKVYYEYLTNIHILQNIIGIIQLICSLSTVNEYPSYIREFNILYNGFLLYLYLT